MEKPTKYPVHNEELNMANEPLGVVANTAMPQMPLSQVKSFNDHSDDMDIPSLQYSLEELKDRIAAGIEQYHNGEYYTQDEAHALIDSWILRV